MRLRLDRLSTGRLPRDLHPVAWWVWSLGLAACASFTTNPWILLLLIGVACLTVAARRGDQPWADAFRIYLWLGVMIVVVRVLFRVLLGGGDAGRVRAAPARDPLPHWALGIRLLGDVTSQSVLAGLYDGLRLAAIVICVGCRQRPGQPEAAAALGATRALRDRQRAGGRDHRPAAAGREPASGAAGAEPARR